MRWSRGASDSVGYDCHFPSHPLPLRRTDPALWDTSFAVIALASLRAGARTSSNQQLCHRGDFASPRCRSDSAGRGVSSVRAGRELPCHWLFRVQSVAIARTRQGLCLRCRRFVTCSTRRCGAPASPAPSGGGGGDGVTPRRPPSSALATVLCVHDDLVATAPGRALPMGVTGALWEECASCSGTPPGSGCRGPACPA